MRPTHLTFVSLFGFLTVAADSPALPIGAAAGEHVLTVPKASSAPTYGTSTSTAYVVSMLDFVPPHNLSWDTYVVSEGIYRYQNGPPQSDWFHGLFLPNGALIERIEILACDDSPNGQIVFGMGRSQDGGLSGNITPVGETGFEGSPGCGLYSVSPFDPDVQVDNSHYSYWAFVTWNGDFTVANRVSTIRVYYRLQVSPAPLTATFADVPTSHPFFQYIEALAAAGITVGCGDGIYCPDDPATRGQVAALLALALGLHFP